MRFDVRLNRWMCLLLLEELLETSKQKQPFVPERSDANDVETVVAPERHERSLCEGAAKERKSLAQTGVISEIDWHGIALYVCKMDSHVWYSSECHEMATRPELSCK